MLSINYRDPRPIYEQVRDGLRQLILSGAIAPGEKLPSVRELAVSLAINPGTIQRAYRELESLGLINTVAGKGAFAATDGQAAQKRQQELLDTLSGTVRELKLLGADPEDLTAVIQKIYGEEEKP
jgi:GntR family transcriptional regulator